MENKLFRRFCKRYLCIILALLLAFSCLAFANEVCYLPDVTEEMTDASYWSKLQNGSDKILMTPDEIQQLNQLTTTFPASKRIDLKNASERFDGIARNEALQRSATADAEHYFGWTFLGKPTKALWDEFQQLIDNCYDINAEKNQPVKFGIAVNRTLLQVFPSETPIWDDPADPDFDYQALSSINVNEPLLLYTKSMDGKYYQAQTSCCSGWVIAEDVAICQTKDEWLSA